MLRSAALAVLLAATASPAWAQNRLALACLENRTGTIDRINFQYRFGSDEWRSASVDSGYWNALKHWYDFPNENAGPNLDVRFDADATSGTYYQTVRVTQYAVPSDNCNNNGKKYRFTKAGNRISLEAIN